MVPKGWGRYDTILPVFDYVSRLFIRHGLCPDPTVEAGGLDESVSLPMKRLIYAGRHTFQWGSPTKIVCIPPKDVDVITSVGGATLKGRKPHKFLMKPFRNNLLAIMRRNKIVFVDRRLNDTYPDV